MKGGKYYNAYRLKALIERYGNKCPVPITSLEGIAVALFDPRFCVFGGADFAETAQTLRYLRGLIENNDLRNLDELISYCDELDKELLNKINDSKQ